VSTARIWSDRQPAFSSNLRGYEVDALDGRVGTVAEATGQTGRGYVVVDADSSVFRKKVVLPAGVIDRVDRVAKRVYVNRTKNEIKNAPEFGESGYDDDAYRIALGRYYGSGGAGFRAPAPRDPDRGSDMGSTARRGVNGGEAR
jgi:hypothetical protein